MKVSCTSCILDQLKALTHTKSYNWPIRSADRHAPVYNIPSSLLLQGEAETSWGIEKGIFLRPLWAALYMYRLPSVGSGRNVRDLTSVGAFNTGSKMDIHLVLVIVAAIRWWNVFLFTYNNSSSPCWQLHETRWALMHKIIINFLYNNYLWA